jgi:hypothetical protein
MANCAIYIKGTDTIAYFIKDCIQSGRDFRGSNGSVTGVKEHLFDVKWTEDTALPVYDEQGHLTGYDKTISSLSEALRYNGQVVSSGKEVDNITVSRIRERYTINDELKMARIAGTTEWAEYNNYVSQIVTEGRAFKNTYFQQEDKKDG